MQISAVFTLRRTELIYDSYLNLSILVAAYGDSVHGELDDLAALQERLFCILFERFETIS